MTIAELNRSLNFDGLSRDMHRLMTELYPICRSITGRGLRKTLDVIKRFVPLEVVSILSGTAAFDWTIPKEWNIEDAWIKDTQGRKVVDFADSNLHVVSYSRPIKEKLRLSDLKRRLFTMPEHPDWVPYRTTYYNEDWGFCLAHRQLQTMEEGFYEVSIDSSLEDGHLTYGELLIPGSNTEEVLISCHVCHPSLANDNLSGLALTVFLARLVGAIASRHYTYRFIWIPGTIGAIAWLYRNQTSLSSIRHGLVVSCVGDLGRFTYKKSRGGDAEIDRTVQRVLGRMFSDSTIVDFSPYGYDERQYCSPGFDLPVGSLTRTPYACYPEYHSSADNLDFVQPRYLAESLAVYFSVLEALESSSKYVSQCQKCEPQLGKRGLYGPFGKDEHLAMLWVLNLSDGSWSLDDISERSRIDPAIISAAADKLVQHGLLKVA